MSELEKWSEVHEDVVTIEEFIDHICANGYSIHKHHERADVFGFPETIQPILQHERRKLLEKFFDIDAEKLEQERRALLQEARSR